MALRLLLGFLPRRLRCLARLLRKGCRKTTSNLAGAWVSHLSVHLDLLQVGVPKKLGYIFDWGLLIQRMLGECIPHAAKNNALSNVWKLWVMRKLKAARCSVLTRSKHASMAF